MKPIPSSTSEEQQRSIEELVGKRLEVYGKLPGWDTIDEVKANMLGWNTYSFGELQLVHHRLTGTAEGLLRDRDKARRGLLRIGISRRSFCSELRSRLIQKPYVTGSAAIFYGLLKGLLDTRAARERQTIHQVLAYPATQTSLRTRNHLEVTAVRNRKRESICVEFVEN